MTDVRSRVETYSHQQKSSINTPGKLPNKRVCEERGRLHVQVMPAGCTVSDWMSTGTCRLQFTGLRAMLNKDVTLRLVITRCPAFPEGVPDVYVDCVGADCGSVFEVGSPSECPNVRSGRL